MIAIYYISDYFDVEGLPGKAKYKRAIQILNILFNFKLREYDHDIIMAWIGNAYKKLGLIEDAYEYYVKAGLEGLYYLYLYYYDKKNFKAADKMYADYKMVSHADPGGIYFDL